MSDYDFGDVTRISFEFEEESGLVDPAVVRVKVRTPEPRIKTYLFGVAPEVTKLSAGRYEIKVKFTRSGQWLFWLEGKNSHDATELLSLMVAESPFYNADGSEKPDTP